jgi:transcriptional antiterminator RfaH
MPILPKDTNVFPENLLREPVPETDGRRWWVTFTRSNQEKAQARFLFAEKIPFFLPLVPKENLIRGRVIHSYIPLFSRYLFLFASEDERVRSLTHNRVDHLLAVADQEELLADLQHVSCLIEAGAPLTVESRLAPGKRVRVRRGSLKGLEGTITVRRGEKRLVVAVQFLQSGVSVEIDDYMVEPID